MSQFEKGYLNGPPSTCIIVLYIIIVLYTYYISYSMIDGTEFRPGKRETAADTLTNRRSINSSRKKSEHNRKKDTEDEEQRYFFPHAAT